MYSLGWGERGGREWRRLGDRLNAQGRHGETGEHGRWQHGSPAAPTIEDGKQGKEKDRFTHGALLYESIFRVYSSAQAGKKPALMAMFCEWKCETAVP